MLSGFKNREERYKIAHEYYKHVCQQKYILTPIWLFIIIFLIGSFLIFTGHNLLGFLLTTFGIFKVGQRTGESMGWIEGFDEYEDIEFCATKERNAKKFMIEKTNYFKINT